MELGLIGAGRMGAGIARRLAARDHRCVVHDLDPERTDALAAAFPERITAAGSLESLVEALAPPRVVWVMLPAGTPTEDAITALGSRLAQGDLVVDGANSFYKDDVRRARSLAERRIAYLDVGVSGGIWGEEAGFCLMAGGPAEGFERVRPLLEALAPGPRPTGASGHRTRRDAEAGYLHCGPVGAGHFVKMIHNGIEYGLMEAYAEGFDLLEGAGAGDRAEEHRYRLPLEEIAEVWRHGSVVRSWLLDLAAVSLREDPGLGSYESAVADSGEGRWTVHEAVDQGRAAEVIAAALAVRFRSRSREGFGYRLLSAMRHRFGGHGRGPDPHRS